MSRAYYNELNEEAAETLRELIKAGHIAPGDVDERSIEDVRPDDLRGYTQCHFFAGFGVWSAALRLAGWPDDRPVWTGSCPCQPFSAAGKGAGFADERHLWPAWAWLVGECRPPVILGEQVASKDVDPWIDLVQADVEAMGYALGCVPFPSAGVGAPHIRDRAYFMAHTYHARPQGRKRVRERAAERVARSSGVVGIVADTERRAAERQRLDMGSAAGGVRSSARQQRIRDDAGHGGDSRELADARGERRDGIDALLQSGRQDEARIETARRGEVGELADAYGRQRDGLTVVRGAERHRENAGRPQSRGQPKSRREPNHLVIVDADTGVAAGPTNGFWRAADWLLCRDEKWRPVEPGTFPLADGAPARVGRLRGYGNAINRIQAATFIEAAREAIEGMTA